MPDSSRRPTIVLLDADPALGSASAPPDAKDALDRAPLEALGALRVYDATPPAELIERLQGADIALTNKVAIGREVFAAVPSLRLVSVLATGFNIVDVTAAREHGVTVCNVPGYSTASTAQLTFALLLELCHHVGAHAADVAGGGWARSAAFSYWQHPLIELDGKTLGVVGFGAIGQQVARIARAFGMRVLVHTRTVPPSAAQTTAPLADAFVDKATLLRESDVISLHCPLTPATQHFIDGAALAAMKPGALLLNVARGPVVDGVALARALDERRIAGAAVDVLDVEPPPADHPLVRSPRCLVTPHIAWATRAARERLLAATVENLRAFLGGAPIHVVG